MALDPGITGAVVVANTKVYGDTMSTLQSLSIQNAIARSQVATSNMVSHQSALNQTSVVVLAKAIGSVADQSVEDSVAIQKIASSGLAESVAGMLAALSSGQVAAKIGQTTPKVTAKPKV